MLLALVMVVVGLSGTVSLQARSASAAPAQDLTARVECKDDSLSVTFSWKASGDGSQWLDVGTDAGFAPGSFAGTGPLSSTQGSFGWEDPSPNTSYFARINTLDGDAWSASSTLTLNTPPCGTPAPSAGMLELQTRLEQQIASANFRVAVAVTDLQTGETISVNGNRQQFTGCTMNLFALMQAVVDLQNGQYDESRVGELISATIYGSNPVTARDILLISGDGDIVKAMNKINGLIESMGMTDTFYDHPPAYWPAPSLRNISNMTTALDVNRALSALWHGSVVSFEWRDYLFEKMTGVKPGLNYLIPAGVGDGVVGHKNGFFWLPDGWIDNDAGIVMFQRGGQTYAYAITLLAEAIPGEYYDIPMGQAVSSIVWEHFSAKYP